MPLPILAATAGSAALQALQPSTPTPSSATSAVNQTLNFQQLMTAMQQGGVNLKDLMALHGQALQNKLKSLTPQQQQALAHQLFGANLTVQDPTGTSITGKVNNVHLEGKNPSLDVAGIRYSFDKIQGINILAA